MSSLNPVPSDNPRTRVGIAPRFGVQDQLDIVGLARQPIDTRGQQRAAELMNALGLGAGVVDAYTGLRTVQEIGERREEAAAIAREEARLVEMERRARAAEGLQAESDKVEEGLATQHAREWYASVAEKIKLGEITGDEGDDLSAVATDLVTAETDGQSEVYAAAFRDTVMPSLISDLAGFQADTVRQTAVDTMRLLSNRLTKDDPDTIVTAARKLIPRATDAEIWDHLITPGVQSAIDAGDPDMVQRIINAGPQGFEAESLVNAAKAQRAKIDGLEMAAVEEQAFRYTNNKSFGIAEQYVHASRKDGRLGEKDADRILGEINSARTRSTTGVNRDAVRDQVDALTSRAVAEAASIMAAADQTGGILAVGDTTFTDLSGTRHTIDADQRIELAVPLRMEQIARQFAGDPDQMVAQQHTFLAANAQTYDGWVDTLRVGASFALAEGRRIGDDGAPAMPPATTAGFELYRRLPPEARRSHIKDDQTRLFYEMTELALDTEGKLRFGETSGPNIESALAKAALAVRNDARVDDGVRRQIGEAVGKNNTVQMWSSGSFKPFDSGRIRNAPDIAALAERRAEFYLRTMPELSPKAAASKAVESVRQTHARSNGYLIPTSSAVETKVIERVSAYAAHLYTTKHGAEEGIGSDDLVLQPAPGLNDQWELRLDGGGRPNFSHNFFETRYLTARQIMEMSHDALVWERAERKRIEASKLEPWATVGAREKEREARRTTLRGSFSPTLVEE